MTRPGSRRLLLVVIALSLGAALSSQAPVSQDGSGARRRRPRIVAVLSDLLVHSPLEACTPSVHRAAARPGGPVRVATWNIRAARSAPVEAIAAELKAMEADIVALQEVDVRTRRGGFLEQPKLLAAALGYHYVFAASIEWDEGDYGLAVLSRWPLTAVRRHRLESTTGAEPRIVLEATVCAEGRPLRLFNHHADGRSSFRHAGLAEMLGILQPHIGHGILVAGDFNEPADAPGVRSLIEAGLVDVSGSGHDAVGDSWRVDHLLADGPLAPRLSNARIWPTDKSDHHAVVAELDW